jgi:molybdenum cofactor cytidylyltransferase
MITGVLLAAGSSRRFGDAKLLAPANDGVPIGVTSARRLLASVPRAVAVVRPGDLELAELLAGEGLQVVINTRADRGMATSLSCGIRATGPCRGWVIALADMPLVRPETMAAVVARVDAGALLAAPRYHGRRGHPVGFSRELRRELMVLRGDSGARSLFARYADDGAWVDVDDPGILVDVDTPSDLRALQDRAALA